MKPQVAAQFRLGCERRPEGASHFVRRGEENRIGADSFGWPGWRTDLTELRVLFGEYGALDQQIGFEPRNVAGGRDSNQRMPEPRYIAHERPCRERQQER
jgi:hypothetical protein